MLLQLKVYLVAALYLFGIIFMCLFPPRNFAQSGSKIGLRRSEDGNTSAELLTPELLESAMSALAARHPGAATLRRLAPATHHRRPLLALELRSDAAATKPAVLVLGALNGMVWSAPRAILRLAENLLYDASYQTPFFNDYDWYLVPCGNPDGLRLTQSARELPPLAADEWSRNESLRQLWRPRDWYKNADQDARPAGPCFGTNINRNFPFHWQDGVRRRAGRCSQQFAGAAPFSAAEARALARYVDALAERLHLVVHLHASFVPRKEYILFPWRYSLRPPSNFDTLQSIGEYAARHARLQDGRLYEVHQGSSDERVAGTFSDYVAGVVGTRLVYIVKPYHPPYNYSADTTDMYVSKALRTVLSLVRGWRRSTKLNTLSFFGTDVEF